MSENFLLFRLANTEGFGTRTVHYILNILSENNLSLQQLFSMKLNEIKEHFPRLGVGRMKKSNPELLSNEPDELLKIQFEQLQCNDIILHTITNGRYPERLKVKLGQDAPPILYQFGNANVGKKNTVAIIGARNASSEYVSFAKRLSESIANEGFSICSGFAKGTDKAAHAGAMAAGTPSINIVSCGINRIRSRRLLKKVVKDGKTTFISQFKPNESFSSYAAMTRNKTICALSDAVVVISCGSETAEDGKKSGTFHSAMTASALQIPVFVYLPKDTASNYPAGNLELLKRGTTPFAGVDQLLHSLTEMKQLCAAEDYSLSH